MEPNLVTEELQIFAEFQKEICNKEVADVKHFKQ